jgi:hypothetical protein
VKKLWKANFALILQALEFFPAPERLVAAPVDLRGPFRPAEPSTIAFKLRWILAHCSGGSKRKVREGVQRSSHAIHNFSTSTGIVQVIRNSQILAEKIAVYTRRKMRLHCFGANGPEENAVNFAHGFRSGRANS